MTHWEYLFVEVQEHGRIPRAAQVNGQPVEDWKRGPAIYDFAAELGLDGWELVSTNDTEKGLIIGLVFKRPIAADDL